MIGPLPTAPQRNQPSAVFITNADAFVAALPQFVADCNATATTMNTQATAATAAATAAAASAVAAAASAAGALAAGNVGVWVSGTGYITGNCVYSPIDFQTYRRKTNGGGVTDPSADAANWANASGFYLLQNVGITVQMLLRAIRQGRRQDAGQ